VTELSGVAIQVSSVKTSHVPSGLHLGSKLVAGTTAFWKMIGDLESFTLGKALDNQEIIQPVFVSGLARSGSTILTEIISQHPQLACHHYSDFPLTWTPYWWNSLRNQLPLPKQEPRERAHADRLMITSDSVESVEEVLWMYFFPESHNPQRSHVMHGQGSHPLFEKYYKSHIRKLLLVKDRQRYLAKNNYHVTRLEYLLQIFPDARFIIPIREPVQQVASLIKQHRLFSQKNAEDFRVSRQLQMSGHYEFGPSRCPIIVGGKRRAIYGQDIEDVGWYASQWADVYGYLNERMNENPILAKACLVVQYEELCSGSKTSLKNLFSHLSLNDGEVGKIVDSYSSTLTAPEYYQSDFSAEQRKLIQKLTGGVAKLYS